MKLRPFIQSHVKSVMANWQRGPFDAHVRDYYKSNKTLGPSERSIISQVVYDLIRHDVLLSHFTNDIERKMQLLGDLNKYVNDTSLETHIRCSCPRSLFDLVAKDYGEERAFEYFNVLNEKAPLTIRVNPLKTTRDDLMHSMRDLNLRKTAVSPYGLVMPTTQNVNLKDTPQFNDGLFEIQDEASQICALRVECEPKQKVLDYCAGSGGKTMAFAHRMQNEGLIEVHDARPDVLLKARQRFRRAGIQNYQVFSRKYQFDWIMLDVPCTGVGTLRRNPEVKYKINQQSVSELVAKQQQIFQDAIKYLKPDGKVVYTTCSFLKQENEEQMNYFCKQHSMRVVGGEFFQSLPEKQNMDSFFSVTLSRV